MEGTERREASLLYVMSCMFGRVVRSCVLGSQLVPYYLSRDGLGDYSSTNRVEWFGLGPLPRPTPPSPKNARKCLLRMYVATNFVRAAGFATVRRGAWVWESSTRSAPCYVCPLPCLLWLQYIADRCPFPAHYCRHTLQIDIDLQTTRSTCPSAGKYHILRSKSFA